MAEKKLKKYSNFVKENYEMGDSPRPSQSPGRPSPETPTIPDTPTRPRPTRPGITPTEIPSEQDNPLAYHNNYMEEEEGGYSNGLYELADILGAKVENNEILYKNYRIIYPSETEMFHVGNKKFKTMEDVLEYLERDKK
jgi:hypothetical protein